MYALKQLSLKVPYSGKFSRGPIFAERQSSKISKSNFRDGHSRTAQPTIPGWLRLLTHARASSKTDCFQDGRVPPAQSRWSVGLAVTLKVFHNIRPCNWLLAGQYGTWVSREDCLHNTFWTAWVHSHVNWLMASYHEIILWKPSGR